jgi:hypothetical protein
MLSLFLVLALIYLFVRAWNWLTAADEQVAGREGDATQEAPAERRLDFHTQKAFTFTVHTPGRKATVICNEDKSQLGLYQCV